MSNKEKKNRHIRSRTDKKAVVLGTEKKSRTPLVIAVAVAFLLSSGALAFFLTSGKTGTPVSSPSTISADATMVSYPVSLFSDGRARHFEHKYNDLTIRYFILKSADGIIRAAFDACDVCWSAGKGYYQEGDTMVCRNCGRRFASDLVNEVKGGCNPAPLRRAVDGDKLILRVADIVEGKQYFNFSDKV